MNTQLLVLLLALGTFVSGSKRAREEHDYGRLNLWDTLAKDQETIIESAKEILVIEGRYTLKKKSTDLVEACFDLGRIQRLTRGEFTIILASVILVDYYGTVVLWGVTWEKFTEDTQPLFQSPEGMLDFLRPFLRRQQFFYDSQRLEEVNKARLEMINAKMDQMNSEGKIIDSTSYPIMKDISGKHCFNPSYTRHLELLEILDSASYYIWTIKTNPKKCRHTFRKTSVVAIKYARGNDEQVKKMAYKDFKQIFRFVVLTANSGEFDWRSSHNEKLQEHVRPLLLGSAEEKRSFLHELCMRLCEKESVSSADKNDLDLNLLKPDSSASIEPIEPLSDEHRVLLQAAIDSIKEISDDPIKLQNLGKDLSTFTITCALGTVGQIENMTSDDIFKILQFVVLNEQLVRKDTNLEELSKYLSRKFLHCSSTDKLGWLRSYKRNF